MAQSDYLCFTAEDDGCTIALTEYGTSGWTGSYSTDGNTWNTYTLGTTLTLANVGNKIYFKGDYAGGDISKYIQFVMSGGRIAASGNTMSLVAEKKFADSDKTYYSYLFYRLFKNCTCLTVPPELPATSLTNYLGYATIECYSSMFYGCTNLIKAPELPATTLANECYSSMFYGCTSLKTLPKLPATTLASYCYYYMFYGCSNIKLSSTKTDYYNIEYRIPATGTGTAGSNCFYFMFALTGGTFAGTPLINTTYYLHYEEPSINKIVYNNKILLDLTGDTITANALLAGYKAHDKFGKKIVGTGAKDTYIKSASIFMGAPSSTGETSLTSSNSLGITSDNFIGVSSFDGSGGFRSATVDDSGLITANIYASATLMNLITITVLYWSVE